MQLNGFQHQLMVISGLAAATLAGAYLDQPLLGLTTGLIVYITWTQVQIRKLSRWLSHPEANTEVPQSIGLWGAIFDHLHKRERHHRTTMDSLRARIDRIQESTNAMHDGVIIVDAKGTMEWWNDSACDLLGFRQTTDRYQHIFNLIRTPAFKAYFEAGEFEEPLALISPVKPHIHMLVQISLFGEDDRLIVAKDVTRLHRLEQMRRDFVANVSHEIRTPLTVISGYLETLEDSAADVPAKWQRAIGTMSSQSSRMEALVTDLLLLSRIETGEQMSSNMHIEIRPLLQQICTDARTLSGEKQHDLTLNINDNRPLRGDESQVRSAFSNLIFNAVKYTPAQGKIVVTWGCDTNGAYLSVRDTGNGIDPIHIPRLTERFYRADPSRQKETGGTGLGLAIVKHVLINHGGHLDIDSCPGEGSEFICWFPLKRVQNTLSGKPG
jgi:two-component system phosphate regulon sensor histidine kinase PhoR